MKIRLLLCFCLLWLTTSLANAQFTTVRVGVDGLTCSQCSRSVEMRLRKLNFIKDVEMDLVNTRAVLKLKPNVTVGFSQIARAVTDAGFSIRFIDARFTTGAGEQVQAGCFSYKNTCFELAAGSLAQTEKVWNIRFVDKGMIDPVSYKKYQGRKPVASCSCSTRYHIILSE